MKEQVRSNHFRNKTTCLIISEIRKFVSSQGKKKNQFLTEVAINMVAEAFNLG